MKSSPRSRRTRPRTVRRAAEREMRKKAFTAEKRGRGVPPTVEGFEAALRDRGFHSTAEALIARHNQRMQRFDDVSQQLQTSALPLLSSYLPFAFAAEELGAGKGRPPFHSGPTWPDHLAWGLDSTAAAVRLLLSLQPVGASLIARTQLERWSSNLEFNSDAERQPDETTTEWLTRLWEPRSGVPPQIAPVGELFAELSELLHARGPLMPLVWLDVADIADVPDSDHFRLIETISDTLLVSLSRIRGCLATYAEEKGFDVLAETVSSVNIIQRAEGWLRDVDVFLWPMVPKMFDTAAEMQLGAAATGYRRVIDALHSGQSPEEPPEIWPALSFGYQRFRTITVASIAFEKEREMLGERSDPRKIDELSTEAVLAGEMAAMLALWLRQDPNQQLIADAFAVCASALRSAQWLWLEDDPRAMGCLRCVIEQIARVRTWRRNQVRAKKIEANPKTTPRDWIEGAGWRRLSLLNRALGEFAHGSTNVSWEKARGALVSIQDNADDDETAQYTGRTHALTALIFIVSVECAAWTDLFSSSLGDAYRQVIRVDDKQADRATEALMNRVWDKRETPLR